VKTRLPARKDPVRGSNGCPKGTPVAPANNSEASRLCLIGVKIGSALRREIDAYAEAHGISRSRAAQHDLAIARETPREREGVPRGRADELLEALDGVRAAVDILGPPTLGMLRYWPTGRSRLAV
jgi:hypothetical protein